MSKRNHHQRRYDEDGDDSSGSETTTTTTTSEPVRRSRRLAIKKRHRHQAKEEEEELEAAEEELDRLMESAENHEQEGGPTKREPIHSSDLSWLSWMPYLLLALIGPSLWYYSGMDGIVMNSGLWNSTMIQQRVHEWQHVLLLDKWGLSPYDAYGFITLYLVLYLLVWLMVRRIAQKRRIYCDGMWFHFWVFCGTILGSILAILVLMATSDLLDFADFRRAVRNFRSLLIPV